LEGECLISTSTSNR